MQKQRTIDNNFVAQSLGNMQYIHKEQAKNNIINFLSQEVSFRPFDTIRMIDGNIVAFIQLRGFIEISQSYAHQMIIGIPKNFPQGFPIFLISINRATFKINKQQHLLKSKDIILQRDQRGIQFIKFNYPFLTYGWKPMSSLLDVYKQFKNYVNNPPLLIQVNQAQNSNQYNQWQNLHQNLPQNKNNNNVVNNNANNNKPQISTAKLYAIIDGKSIQMSNTFSTLSQLQDQKNKIQYNQCRNAYLMDQHLKELQSHLMAKNAQFGFNIQEVKKVIKQTKASGDCDRLLQIAAKDQAKLQRMAERDALKQAQRVLKQTMQKNLQKGNKKYSDYKKLIRSLFSQMYENQSKILQSVE